MKDLLEMIRGLEEIVIGLCLIPLFASEYYDYYLRWHDPIFHWGLKRERKNKDIPQVLWDMAEKAKLQYRQMETETPEEY